MTARLRKTLIVLALFFASQGIIAACGPGAGFVSPGRLARWEAAMVSKASKDFKILGSYPTPDGKTIVVYRSSIPSNGSQDAEIALGFVVAEADRWGLWHSAGGGNFIKPTTALIDEAIDYQTTYQSGSYSVVFGAVLKPPLTIEANMDNGKVLVDRDGDEGFAFFGEDGADPVQLSVLDQQEKLIEIIHLDVKQTRAQDTLYTFFQNLHDGKYGEAAELYGGAYDVLIEDNPSLDPQDHASLWKNACEINGFQCLVVYSYAIREQLSANEFIVTVQFQDDQGNLFVRGPCCGASETDMPPQSEFDFHVVKDQAGDYQVMDLPVYVP
jgi:hypothetical protein